MIKEKEKEKNMNYDLREREAEPSWLAPFAPTRRRRPWRCPFPTSSPAFSFQKRGVPLCKRNEELSLPLFFV